MAPVQIIELPDPQPDRAPQDTPAAQTAPQAQQVPQAPQPQQAPKATAAAKLYVATPCYGCQMTAAYLGSLLTLQGACFQRGVECTVDFLGNESLVERARNILVARFLKSDATHLLFIDADIAFHPDTVFRLLAADKDVCTAVYAKKSFDYEQLRRKLEAGDSEPVYQMALDYNINIANPKEPITDGMVRVLDSATGFMLIKREVLERMVEHYREELHCVNDIMGQPIREYVALFACMIDPKTRRFLSEDFSFGRRYQAIGGEVWADLASPLSHIGTHVYHGDIRERMVVSVV